MSEIIDKTNDFSSTENLRANDLKVEGTANTSAQASAPTIATEVKKPAFQVKAPIPNPNTAQQPANEVAGSGERTFTLDEVKTISKQIESNLRKELINSGFIPGSSQVMSKGKAPIKDIDFSKLTMDDIYDLTIPIQAKAFGATDALRVELQDKNYEARWVNKNPRRLGQFLAFGFVYVEEKDLARKLEVEVIADAQGHFVLDDVVLMRITKEKYYAALRAAHERAVRTVNSVEAVKAAEREATNFMTKVGGSEFATASSEGKLAFYRPGIEI